MFILPRRVDSQRYRFILICGMKLMVQLDGQRLGNDTIGKLVTKIDLSERAQNVKVFISYTNFIKESLL